MEREKGRDRKWMTNSIWGKELRKNFLKEVRAKQYALITGSWIVLSL